MPPELELNELAGVTGRVRGRLLTAETATRAVQLLAEVAADAVPAAFGGGATLISDGQPTSTGSTSSVVERIDAVQYETRQGPCLTSWASSAVVRVDDTRTELRWPKWAAAAAEAQVLSSISVPLINGRAAIGAMKVYSPMAGAFGEDTTRLLTRLSAAAAALLGHIQTTDTPLQINAQLAEVLRVRDVTNMAKGILMASRQISEDEAQVWLLDSAREQGRPVADVTRRLVDSGHAEGGGTDGSA